MKSCRTPAAVVLWAALIALGIVPEAAADLRVGVSPMKVHLLLEPGEKRVVAVNIFNNGDDAVRLEASVGDWTTTREGGIEFVPLGAHERTASNWIETDLVEFTIPPHSTQVVRVTAVLPLDACGSYWTIVFFEGRANLPRKRAGLGAKVRMATTIYVTAAGNEERDDRLTRMDVVPGKEPGTLDLVTTLANGGNVYYYPQGWFQVLDGRENVLFEEQLPYRVCLPGRETVYRMSWRPESGGSHVFLVTIDSGQPTLIQGFKEFDPSDVLPDEPPPKEPLITRVD